MPNPAYKTRCTSMWNGLRCRIWWEGPHQLHRWWNEWNRVEWHDALADPPNPPADPFPMHPGGRR